ncbi:MAG: O-antigen ligase family protein [Planctomycetota bacterium]|jgi:O-antigen ligase/tetratricopeptide (TPR) repeat protein
MLNKSLISGKKWDYFGGGFGLLFLIWPWVHFKEAISTAAPKREFLAFFSALLILNFIKRKGGGALISYVRSLAGNCRKAFVCLLLFGLFNVVSALLLSYQRMSSFFWLGWLLRSYVIFFAVFLLLLEKDRLKAFLNVFVLSGSLVGFVCFVIKAANSINPEYFTGSASFAGGRMCYPFGMPAGLGIFEVLSALCAVSFLRDSFINKDKRKAVLYFTALLFCMAGIAASGTLSCSVGFAAGLWSLFLFKVKNRRRYLAATALLLFAVISFAIYFLNTAHGRELLYTTSWGIRPVAAVTALRMFAEHPIAGWGPNTVHYAFPHVESWQAFLHGARGDYFNAVHCEPLQVLGELGLVGFGLYAAFFFFLFTALYRKTLRSAKDSAEQYIPVFMLLSAVLCDSLFNPAYRHGEMNVIMFIIFALCFTAGADSFGAEPDVPGHKAAGKLVSALCLVVFAAIAYLSVTCLQGNMYLSAAYHQHKKGEFEELKVTSRLAGDNVQEINLWQKSRGYYSEAFRRTGEIDKAIDVNIETLKVRPVSIAFVKMWMLMNRGKGRIAHQLIPVLYYLNFHPYSVEFRAHLYQVIRLFSPQSLTLFEKSLQQEGSHLSKFDRDILRKLGEEDWQFLSLLCRFEKGQHAGIVIENIEKMDPEKVSIVPLITEFGRMHAVQGNFKKAIDILGPVCREIPADPAALYYYALALEKQGGGENLSNAFTALSRALKYEPGYPQAAILYSMFCMADNNSAEAIQTLIGVKKVNSQYLPIRRALISNYLLLGDSKAAAAEVKEVLKIYPESEEFKNRLGQINNKLIMKK